jgi:MFS family permease
MTEPPAHQEPISTDIPARLDRLPWSRFHWLLVTALGVTWVLDGLEATVVGAIGNVLKDAPDLGGLGLVESQIGLAGSSYLAGAIAGALFFGHLTDRLGRKRLFTITLGIYLAGAVLTAFAWNFWSFLLFRLVTGLAIGGEYSAINSAIDELIPARVRGRVDLAINGTFWVGAALGAVATLVLLQPEVVPEWLGWRVCFGMGALVGGAMILARRHVPESPRWLLTHGRHREAEEIMEHIEELASRRGPLAPVHQCLNIYPGVEIGFGIIIHTLLVRYRSRAVLGLVLIASQAFFYNGIFFTYPLVLNQFFGVAKEDTGLYVLVFAVGNFLGPVLLGRFFDTVGRRAMISTSYALAGGLLLVTEVLFLGGHLNGGTQTLLWTVSFFFASAAASAGYLTVSEIFPLEMRALAIALFFAVGTAVGGLVAPVVFGALVQTHDPLPLFYGYVFGACLMITAAVVELILGVASEQKSLEDVAAPLTSEGPDRLTPARRHVATRAG